MYIVKTNQKKEKYYGKRTKNIKNYFKIRTYKK